MLEGQWRAARALIGWSQTELAQEIDVSVITIKRMESGLNVSEAIRNRAKGALEAAGVIFVEENGEGPGVRIRKDARTSNRQQPEPKVCPECDHVFQGNGWDGIDAHWKAKHSDVMPYEEAWPLIKSETYMRTARGRVRL